MSERSGSKFYYLGDKMINILIIEDDNSARLVTRLHLKRKGWISNMDFSSVIGKAAIVTGARTDCC